MNDIIKDLDKLSKEIDESKKNVASYEGQKLQLMKQLEELGYKTLEEIEKDIGKMSKKVTDIGEEIEKSYEELKEKYEW